MAVLSSCDIIPTPPTEEESSKDYPENVTVTDSVNVGFYYKEANAAEFKEVTNSPIFDKSINWERGKIMYVTFKIVNEGNLIMSYRFDLTNEGCESTEDGYPVSNIVCVYEFDKGTVVTPDKFTMDQHYRGPLSYYVTDHHIVGTLMPNRSYEFVLALHMVENGLPEYYGLSLGDVGVKLTASAIKAENDSFGNQYDK